MEGGSKDERREKDAKREKERQFKNIGIHYAVISNLNGFNLQSTRQIKERMVKKTCWFLMD